MPAKSTTEEFIKRATEKHNNKYDYSKVDYESADKKIKIICPVHGEFEQTPSNHLYGYGCMLCGKINMSNKSRKTKEQFIEEANKNHDYKYDYSKIEYVNNHTSICVICPTHGEFWQKPSDHVNGHGCSKCSGGYNDTEFFIERSNKTHNFRYNYSKSKYVNKSTKICIICPIHGEFWQLPGHHMKGNGCTKCHLEKPNSKLSNTDEFINKANVIHENKYTYEKTVYVKSRIPVTITCSVHGDFQQTPFGHLRGYGCQKCANEKTNEKLTILQEDVINRFIKRHGNKYDYSKVKYKGLEAKVCIICKEHGEFNQIPKAHWNGCGCQKCSESRLETEIRVILENNNIKYIYEERFNWLGRQTLDFYLLDYNIAIECQGEQHFRPIEHFGGVKKYKKDVAMDLKKFNLCKENGIKLYYFANESPENYLDKIYLDKQELLSEILK